MSLALKRLIPYLTPLISFTLLEFALARPAKGWIYLLITLALGLLSFFFLAYKRINKKNVRLLLPGILFFLSFVLFFFFLVLASSAFKHIFGALIIIFLGMTLEATFHFFHGKKNTSDYADFFSYLNLLTIFMFFSSLGSVGIFLGAPGWLLFLTASAFSFIIFYSNYYTDSFTETQAHNDITGILNQKLEDLILKNKSQKILFTIIPALVLVELFWALTFLPTSIYVNAFIMTACYYATAGIIKNRISGSINNKLVRKYLIIGGACLLLIIFTARV